MTEMDHERTAGHDPLVRRKRYTRLFYGLIGAGIVGYLLLLAVWNQTASDVVAVAAVGLYWLGFFLALGVYYFAPAEIEDERDEEISQQASGLTMYAATLILVLGAPGSVTLEQTGVYEVPSWYGGMMWGYVLLFVIYAGAHLAVKRQYS